ncbi:hypothetical protein V2J09_011857 [Rumex salicifolius]
MPTPVSTARQCLTEEAARVLDDAVAVARRRCHAQTTSLHAVSALLALPSSILRDACSRSRSPAYSPRLQFRALDLCVSVSLDRLPSAKSSSVGEDDPPPVSNSLMAAIKRSQANQRRQPEMYQITQITSPISSISSIKVELKNFVVSILDDPIVSRVLGDAGFRSTEIKIAILHPPPPPPSARFLSGATASGGRYPPLFLCNLPDSGYPIGGNIPFPFPLAGSGVRDSDGDANSKRIGEVLAKSTGRNPLLVGVCAKDALASFKECIEKDRGESTFPTQIVGLHLISIEKDIMEFLSIDESTEVLESKLEELSSAVEKHSSPGVIVSFGELKVLMEEGGRSENSVKFLVLKLSALFELHKKKMWFIGATANYETYRKFLNRFPSLETDWDLHPLPITSSRSSVGELSSKSSLLGSFVPFGGFFSMPSDFRNPLGVIKKTIIRCTQCNEKCDREVSAIMKGDSSVSVADQHSSTLPSWLQTANSNMNKASIPEITVDKAESSEKKLELQRKWDDICQRLHHQTPKIPRLDTPIANPGSLGFQSFPVRQRSGNGSLHSNDPSSLNLQSSVSAIVQKPLAQEQNVDAPVLSLHDNGDLSARTSCSLSLAPEIVSSSSISSITTELQLGTFTPTSQELKKTDFNSNRVELQQFSCSNKAFPSSPSGPDCHRQLGDQLDQSGDYKQIMQKLIEKISWQSEACHEIAQIVSRRRGGVNVRRDAWICFTGFDRMGKKRMAGALAELMFGSRENLISIDLSIQGRGMIESHSMIEAKLPDDVDVRSGRKAVVDYLAEELRKKPCSVVFLENVDKATDILVQTSLSHAIKSGKFRDSRGREISIMNAVFLMACSSTRGDQFNNHMDSKFTEDRILKACSWQMQIVIDHVEDKTDSNSSNKRKQSDTKIPSNLKKPKGFLDLNIPLEEEEEEDINDDMSGAWFEDLLGKVETKIAFKPFDFDALANKLLSKMNLILQRKSGSELRLEVDEDAMLQILAAIWCSDQENAVDNWINEVVCETCIEAQRKFSLHKQTHLKIISCPGRPIEQEQSDICLPRMINFS